MAVTSAVVAPTSPEVRAPATGRVRIEAVDVLRRIVDGDTSEVVDRALADLLGL